MQYQRVIQALSDYAPPDGWGGGLFLLPEPAMRDIYDHIVNEKAVSCIELGTGFGATSCVIAAALDELGGGRLVTVDRYLHQPVNVEVLMQHVGLDLSLVEAVADELGYNWYLPDLISAQTRDAGCEPLFDFCLLDGAHEWEPDALAFYLVADLLREGAWIAIDDLDFNLRMIPNCKESHPGHTDRELDAFQMAMVFDRVVRRHPLFSDFAVTHGGRIGWARKTPAKGDDTGPSPAVTSEDGPRLSELARRAVGVARERGLVETMRRILRHRKQRD